MKGELIMEGTTSTSNEGSKKRDLNQYKQMQTKNVSKRDITKAFSNGYEDFDVNCMAFNVNTIIKEANGANPVSASSADSYEFSLEELEKHSIVWSQTRNITPEKAPTIRKKRKEAKKKRDAEKEAREAEVARSIKSNIEDESNLSKIDTDLDNNNR